MKIFYKFQPVELFDQSMNGENFLIWKWLMSPLLFIGSVESQSCRDQESEFIWRLLVIQSEGSVMYISTKSGIMKQSLSSGLVTCIHFLIKALGKVINPFLLPHHQQSRLGNQCKRKKTLNSKLCRKQQQRNPLSLPTDNEKKKESVKSHGCLHPKRRRY